MLLLIDQSMRPWPEAYRVATPDPEQVLRLSRHEVGNFALPPPPPPPPLLLAFGEGFVLKELRSQNRLYNMIVVQS